MKVSIEDLEKALKWVKSNTNAVHVQIEDYDPKLIIKTTDKYDKTVEIVIFDTEKSKSMPTITSTDRLR